MAKNNTLILIVEDRPDFQRIFQMIIDQKLGYDSMIASSFEDARKLLQGFDFHLAMVDLSLDDTDINNRDGFRVLDLIKELDNGTQAIIFTAYGRMKDADIVIKNYDVMGFVDKGDMDIQNVISSVEDAVKKAVFEKMKSSRILRSNKDE